jgi:hypothetical protein
MKNIRCLEWCQQNKTSTMCVCPKESSTKKLADDDKGKRRDEVFFEEVLFCFNLISLL